MKLGVLADIHSNYEAFKSCVQYLEKIKVDAYVFLGDYIGELPCPELTMALMREIRKKRKCYIIRGNKEEYLLKGLGGDNPEWDGYPSTVGMLRYSFEHASKKDIDFFASLPIERTIEIEGYPAIRICHGSVDSAKGTIEKEKSEYFDKIPEKYILCGHTHLPRVTYIADKIIWNPGSVGLPVDGVMSSRCMVLHGRNHDWKPEYVEVPYDVDAEVKSMRAEGLYGKAPYWSIVTEDQLKGGTVGHLEVLNRAMWLCENETGHCEWPKIPEEFMRRAVNELIYME